MSAFERQGRTDHLDLVLQAISVAYQTGVLHVERGKGGVREGGDIVVFRGQIVSATTGSRQGDEALEWLLTWGNCHYNFQEKPSGEVFPSPPPAISFPITPVPDAPVTAPLVYSNEVLAQNLLRTFSNGTESDISTSPNVGYAPLPAHLLSLQRQREPQEIPRHPQEISRFPQAVSEPPMVQAPIARAPIRLQSGSAALAVLDRFKFSRLHRHVFLLLDGKRTSRDLVRLTGHPLDDVERLIADLERIGLVRWERF